LPLLSPLHSWPLGLAERSGDGARCGAATAAGPDGGAPSPARWQIRAQWWRIRAQWQRIRAQWWSIRERRWRI
jgi:hypothetical protein